MSNDPVLAFVQQLRQSQLLDAAQLDEVERLRPAATRPAQLAGELVRRGWLTPHQANQVALGRGAGLVLGSYVVLEPIGGGGMGQVVKARHRYMQRNVALKLIRQDQRDSADVLERFQRETRLLAELHHPHIVQAYDAGLAGDVWFLAMELLEGTDLAALVHQRGRLPVALACEYTRQAALGLQHAHQRGLVHRDIKPSNLFLTAEGLKLLDLGLARPQASGGPGELTQNNGVMGTPDYLAPEQAVDPRKAGTRSDLYSLGCTLHFLLTGRPPFPEGTLAQKLLAHQNTEPVPIERILPDVPPALALLLRRMLAKRPEDRPLNAAEVAAQLAPLSSTASPDSVPIAAAAATADRGRSILYDPTVAPQPPSPVRPGAPLSAADAVFQSETVLPAAQGPSTVVNQTSPPPQRRDPLIADTVVSPVSRSPGPNPPLFGIPPVWLRIGVAGGGALLLVLLAVVFWPRSKAAPEENQPDGSAGSGPLETVVRTVGNVSVTELKLPAAGVPPCLCWSPDGKAFYHLESEKGILRRINLAESREDRKLDLGEKCGWVAVSAEGVLLAVSNAQEVWVLDPVSLRVLRRIAAASVKQVASGPASSVAVADNARGDKLLVLDLKKGEILKEYSGRDFTNRSPGLQGPVMTPDGKYVVTHGGELIHRFKLANGELTFEESSHRIIQGRFSGINLSVDGSLVCAPCGGGNYANPPPDNHPSSGTYSTYVYPITNLRKPAFVLHQGPYPQAVGFDPRAGLAYSHGDGGNLLIFNQRGVRLKALQLEGGNPTHFLVHLDGWRFLMLTDQKLRLVEVPKP